MKYVMYRPTEGQLSISIWEKSQFFKEKGREYFHTDYIKEHKLSEEKIVSIGEIHYKKEEQDVTIQIEHLYIQTPEFCSSMDKKALRGAAEEFYIKYGQNFSKEIEKDWDNYQLILKKQAELRLHRGK